MNAPAPRKSRRLRYWIAGVAFFLLAAPFVFYFVAGWMRDRELEQIYREIEAEEPNWRLADLIAQLPPPPADENNSALQILKVNELLNDACFDWDHRVTQRNRNARLTDEQTASLKKKLGAVGPAVLKESRKLKDMPAGRFAVKFDADDLHSTNPPTQKCHMVMKLLHNDAALRADGPDKEGAAESVQALLHVTHTLAEHPGQLAQIVHLEGQNLSVLALERTLGQGEFTEKRLQVLQAALTQESEHDVLYITMLGERAFTHETYLSMRAGTRPTMVDFGTSPGWKVHLYRVFPQMALDDYPDVLRILCDRVRASKLHDGAQDEAFQELISKVQGRWPGAAINHFNDRAEYRKPLTKVRCAIVAVAAERYRLEHKNWPNRLDDLVKAGLLKDIPKDPYDYQPLRFKTTENYLVVYAVGETKVDDGGVLSPFNVRADGLGFVIWDPRMRHVAPPAGEEMPKKKRL